MDIKEQLKELQDQIESLQTEKTAYLTQTSTLQTELSEVMGEEESVLSSVQQEIENYRQKLMAEATQRIVELREKQKKLSDNRQQAYSTANQIELRIQEMKKNAARLLEAAQAEASLDELKTRLADIFDSTEWGAKIRPYQQNDVLTIAQVFIEGGSGVGNFNPMGLGKTFETAAAIDIITHLFYQQHERKPRILFLTRQKLVGEAARELHRWTETLFVPMVKLPNIDMRRRLIEMALTQSLPIVTNYEALASTPYLLEIKWDLVIGDEIHRLKGGAKPNRKDRSRVFNNMDDLLVPKHPEYGYFDGNVPRPFLLALSGSPAQNKAEEMWCYLYLLRPDLFPSFNDFKDQYTEDRWDDRVGKYVAYARMEKIMGVLGNQAIRNDPDDIGIQRPTKEHIYNVLDLSDRPSQEALYKQLTKELFIKLDAMDPNASMSIGSVLPLMTRQWQCLVWPKSIQVKELDNEGKETGVVHSPSSLESVKIDRAVELIEDIVAEGENVVVWSIRFKEPLHELKRRCEELGFSVAILDGDTKNPDQVSEDFRQNKIQVLLANAQAAAEGFNWQRDPSMWPGGARKAIFLDRWWNPEFNKQCEDRIVRPTADNAIPLPVEIYILHVENSFDDLIKVICEVKDGVIAPIVNYEGLKPRDLKKLLGYGEDE